MIKKHVPNFITCLNLFAGSLAVYYALNGAHATSFYLILLAAVFDFLDGLAARVLKAYSPMGKELDSLADMVSFGLAPGATVFCLLQYTQTHTWLSFVAFTIPVFSALRLAKFNIDERQTSSFLGLPTPANALFWMGLTYSFYQNGVFVNAWVIIALIVLMNFLLVSEIPMFSLKFKNFNFAENILVYALLIVSVVFLLLLGLEAFAPIIAVYMLLSVVKFALRSN